MKIFLPFLFLLNLFTCHLYAEAHREPSVLPAERVFEELQIVREDGHLYRKELVRDGIRMNVIASGSKPVSQSWTYTDFVSKKFCGEENTGRLLIAFTKDNDTKAKEACVETLEGKVEFKDLSSQTLRCRYSCKNTSLEALQSVFFESFVRYIEPNASRGLN